MLSPVTLAVQCAVFQCIAVILLDPAFRPSSDLLLSVLLPNNHVVQKWNLDENRNNKVQVEEDVANSCESWNQPNIKDEHCKTEKRDDHSKDGRFSMLSINLALIKVLTGEGMIVCKIVFVGPEMLKVVPELDHLDESANSINYPFNPS